MRTVAFLALLVAVTPWTVFKAQLLLDACGVAPRRAKGASLCAGGVVASLVLALMLFL